MRNAFAKEITRIAKEDPRVVLLSGDIGNRLFDDFKRCCPDRYINCGIAEGNMIGVAAGLALAGFRPVCYTIAPFVTYRCLEQIRVDLCYHHLPVLLVGTGAGLAYASLGATHHSCEDVAMMRALPEMTVFTPADEAEVRGLLEALRNMTQPAYMRIGKKGEPCVHTGTPTIEVGRALQLRRGTDVAFLSSGVLLPEVLEACEELQKHGVTATVYSFPTVKPLDTQTLQKAFSEHELVVSVEEHSVIGGFSSAVSEWKSDQDERRCRHLRLGTPDQFFHTTGEQEDARKDFGLTRENMVRQVLALLPCTRP